MKTNFFRKLKYLWHSLFYGMKAADTVIQSQSSGENTIEIQEKIKPTGVYADMLEQKVTKEVEELRDKHYRVLKEADKYKIDTLTMREEEITNELGEKETIVVFSGGMRKKSKADFMKHPPVYEKDGKYLLRVIQDNKIIEKESLVNNVYVPSGIYDYETLLTIDRDIIPRFEIEKFVKRIVVRNKIDTDRAEVDFYLPSEAGQFSKIDAILISNLFTMFDTKNLRSDITDIKGIEWNCDKAWNASDLNLFKYDDITPIDIVIFDGNFVITFDCHIVEDGTDIVSKYKTKELDEKYETNAVKKTADLFAVYRKVKKEEKSGIDIGNIESTTIKLQKE